MKKLFILASLLIGGVAIAQEQDSTKTRPGQVTFFYPIGTNGIDAPSYHNNVSFNVLYGINGGFTGVEFGGLVNMNLGSVRGVQFGGIANITTGSADGIVFGGICNIVKDSSNTVSFAGISNVMGKSAIGLHYAGISNLVNGCFMGAQFGGITNTVNGAVTGAQFAGISNIANGDFIGLQAAGISNIANGKFIGAQVGLINTAHSVKGVQIGLINVAESFEKGVPLGLISYVKNGFHALEISTNESIFTNVSFKMGVDQLYTIYKVGFTANEGTTYLTYGIGLGGMYSFNDKMKASLDLSANHIIESSYYPRLDILSKADLAFRYHLTNHIALFGGPSLNVYTAQYDSDTEKSALHIPYVLFEDKWWNNEGITSVWIGGNLGLSICF